MNGIRDNGDDIETVIGTGPLDLKKQQKKTLKEIGKLVYATRLLGPGRLRAHTSSYELVQGLHS